MQETDGFHGNKSRGYLLQIYKILPNAPVKLMLARLGGGGPGGAIGSLIWSRNHNSKIEVSPLSVDQTRSWRDAPARGHIGGNIG